MMTDPRRQRLLLLTVAVLVGEIVRYPFSPHEFGADTFAMQGFADTIVKYGRPLWLDHPLSWVGYYPLSYPPGSSMITAVLKTDAGIDSETAVLIASHLIGLLAMLSVCALGARIFRNPTVGIVAGLLYQLTTSLVLQTIWGFTGRTLAMALLPLMFLAVSGLGYRGPAGYGKLTPSLAAAFCLLAFTSLVCHHIAALLIGLAVAYRVSLRFLVKAPVQSQSALRTALSTRRFQVGFVPAVALALITFQPGPRPSAGFLLGISQTTEFALAAAAWIIELGFLVGPYVVLAMFGAPRVILHPSRVGHPEIVGMLWLATATIFFEAPSYIVMFTALPLAILASRGASLGLRGPAPRLRLRSPRATIALVSLVVVTMVPFYALLDEQVYSTHRGPDQTSFWLDEETYSTAIYVDRMTDNAPLASYSVKLSTRMGAVTGHPAMTGAKGVLAVNGTLGEYVEVHSVFELRPGSWVDALDLAFRSRALFLATDPSSPDRRLDSENEWVDAMFNPLVSRQVLQFYHVEYYHQNPFEVPAVPAYLSRQVTSSSYQTYGDYLDEVYLINYNAV